MQPLSQQAASAYRRIELDARIEASSGEDLTLICLEEVVSALSQALFSLDRSPGKVPTEPLSRAHGIALWLARSVAPANPVRAAMVQFYGGLAEVIKTNFARPSAEELAQVRTDYADLLAAVKTA